MTVGRWIGELGIFSTSVAGAWGIHRVSLGIAMLDADAATAGAMPDPNSSTDHPPQGWVYRTHCIVAQNGTGMNPVTRCQFDLRGMRKFENSVAYLIINNESLNGTSFTVRVAGVVRGLILL